MGRLIWQRALRMIVHTKGSLMPYLFGDSDRAVYRLQVLADVFASSSRTFLQDVVKMPPRLALDLGSGPGYTTHLL
jgi:trans-aconitate 2-methyltransferase